MSILALSILVVALISTIAIPNVRTQESKTEGSPVKKHASSLGAEAKSIVLSSILCDRQLKDHLLREYRKRKKDKNEYLYGIFFVHFDAEGFVDDAEAVHSLHSKALVSELVACIRHCHAQVPLKLRECTLRLKLDEIIAEALKMSTTKIK